MVVFEKTYALKDLDEVVSSCEHLITKFPIWLFEAPMSAGKTTFISALCKHWGVVEPVTSPTFGLVHPYLSKKMGEIYHFDLYRLHDVQEAFALGITEYLNSGSICFIEWPEKIKPWIESKALIVSIEKVDETHRKLCLREFI